jgi:hypothetical protein
MNKWTKHNFIEHSQLIKVFIGSNERNIRSIKMKSHYNTTAKSVIN